MQDYVESMMYTPKQREEYRAAKAAEKKAEETRKNALFGAHFVLAVGYVGLCVILLGGWLALAVSLVLSGVHGLLANRVWRA